MTGAVTFEQLIWLLSVIFVAGSAVAGFLFWVWRIVVGLKRDQATAIEKLESALKQRDNAAQLEKERAKIVEEGLRKMITDHAQHIAETYATKDGVNAGLGRVEKSIDRLAEQVGSAVERLTGRLDRVLEARSELPASMQPR